MNESKMEMLLTAQAMVNARKKAGDNDTKIIIMTNFGIIECELDHRIKISDIKNCSTYSLTQLAFSIDDDSEVDQNEEVRINKDCVLLKDAIIRSFSSSRITKLGSVCFSVDSVQGVSVACPDKVQ